MPPLHKSTSWRLEVTGSVKNQFLCQLWCPFLNSGQLQYELSQTILCAYIQHLYILIDVSPSTYMCQCVCISLKLHVLPDFRRTSSIENSRRALLLYKVYGEDPFWFSRGTSLICNNALLALNWRYVSLCLHFFETVCTAKWRFNRRTRGNDLAKTCGQFQHLTVKLPGLIFCRFFFLSMVLYVSIIENLHNLYHTLASS